MNYERLWMILEVLIVELTKKGVTIPQELIDDLKSAKLYILTYKINSTELNIVEKIEIYIENLESNLIYLAELELGKDYADKWMKKIYRARTDETPELASATKGFITGVPKGEYWIRINLSGLIQNMEIHELLETMNLSSTPQENGYLMVHGREENVKAFVKKVSEKIRVTKK